MPIRDLPGEPSLEHLRNEAREFQRLVAERDADAVATASELHPRLDLAAFKLADAQLVVARQYGFPSWPKLHAYVESVNRYSHPGDRADGEGQSDSDRFLRLCLIYMGAGPEQWQEARELLAAEPELASASIYTIAAVGDVAAAAEALARDGSQATRRGGPNGWEALLYAAYSRLDSASPDHSTLEVARLLLEHGADPNAGWIGSWGPPPFTALTGAFGYGEDAPNQPPHEYELELARLLLEAGADANDAQTLYNNMGRPSNEHLELLFAYGLGTGDGSPWRQRLAPNHPTPAQLVEEQLRFSAASGNLERVELLIRHGVDVNGPGMNHPILRGRNALELALGNGHREVAAVLREAGATAAAFDRVDELLVACMSGDQTLVRELLVAKGELAAEAVARDPRRLIAAVELDRPEAVRLLVEIGFEVNPKHGAATPLHLAAFAGNRAMVDLLLELRADPTAKEDEYEGTPADWAGHAHHDELADYLRGREASSE